MVSSKVDYRFFEKFEELFDAEELEEFLTRSTEFFVEYVQEKWLNQYFKMKTLSSASPIPNITSTISDTPPSNTNEFNSKTESYALKSVVAHEWLKHFHEKLNMLPEDFKDIIEMKYLTRREDGRAHSDLHVYSELSMSRAFYYELKKEALEELGRLLYPCC